MSLTYKDSGVDISKGDDFVERIKLLCKPLINDRVVDSIGGFSAKYRLNGGVITATTDGVGTKLKIAFLSGKHDTIGVDLVAMNVNDIVVDGATPLFFLDYIAYSNVDNSVLEDVIKGIVGGLKTADCPLIGGETAQMPGFYRDGEYDLSGFCVGFCKADELMPTVISKGDIIVGVASNGFHSNGYSLLRKVFFDVGGFDIDSEIEGVVLGDLLLKPTRIYAGLMKKVKKLVKAASHITGGGFYSNIPRVLGKDVDAVLYRDSYEVPWEFKLVQSIGSIPDEEMYKTFNMGIGLVLFLDESNLESVMSAVSECGFEAFKIGFVDAGRGGIRLV